MGWEHFKGNTTGIDISKGSSNSGNLAKAFGDAFINIGNSIAASTDQSKRNELLGLQIQNEQAKVDDAKTAKAQKKLDDAFKTDIGTLNINTTDEAKQNAIDSLKTFYKPSVDAQGITTTDVANREKTILAQNNDAYKAMILSAPNKQELSDAWIISGLGDRGYKPGADIVKERDAFFQGKFNDEAVNVATSGNYKNMSEFTKANPELVKNADGVTMAKVEQHFSGKVKDAFDRGDKDRLFNLKQQELNDNRAHNQAMEKAARDKASSDANAASEKDSKVVDAINKIITTKFGKSDPASGMISIGQENQAKANWIGTRALHYASNGNNASTSYIKAEKDYNAASKKSAPAKDQDPLGIR